MLALPSAGVRISVQYTICGIFLGNVVAAAIIAVGENRDLFSWVSGFLLERGFVMEAALVRQLRYFVMSALAVWSSFSSAYGKEAGQQEQPKPAAVQRTVVGHLQTEVPKLLARHHVPGLSMILIRNRKRVWSHAFGRKRNDREDPVTEQTVFEAASMSKPLFAYAVLKLVEQGVLDLDRPLDSYLPEPYLPGQPDAAKITARMVLTHTTGFPNWRREKPLVVLFQPGKKYGYSGEGFLYLQRVVEHLVDQDLESWVRAQLLVPLKMSRSSYVWQKKLADDFAGGHDKDGKFKQDRRFYSQANSAYTLYTTPQDYGMFLLEMMRPDHERPYTLKPAMRLNMLTDQDAPGSYGLGWALSDEFVFHSGSNGTGFRCYSRFHKTSGDGLVVMTNGVNGAAVWKAVVQIIDAEEKVLEDAPGSDD